MLNAYNGYGTYYNYTNTAIWLYSLIELSMG